ncbi:DUF5691 domain-containing protein [Nocardia sp. NPDC050435]|uniref:DUF5691 domain-containing protein n=1 Tax=Nocardia sp. NPDC050435 TaxID=3155040 RepID=UPI0033D1B12D
MSETQVSATPESAAARQRAVRVSAGLAELDVWLGDQVRTGLAQAERSGRVFATMAARMVDAQAPGVAAVLRRLPELVAGREEWPDLLLREYARLHLLIAAHRRLDELTPELRASVRTHVGYPTRAAEVREQPALRDAWQVLGVRLSEEERLHTRRTWLYGRRTGRWALLVEHHFGTPEFPKDVPGLGMMAEAEVHFYPGAAPLRALWGERFGADEPFTTLPLAVSGVGGKFLETPDSHEPVPASVGESREPALSTDRPGVGNSYEPTQHATVGGPDKATQPTTIAGPDEPTQPATIGGSGEPELRVADGDSDEPALSSDRQGFAGVIDSALAGHARALAADPWLRAWPVLLTDIVPVLGAQGWQVAEIGGTALPLSPGESPWQLLGISGGHPVTVIGEWTTGGLVPISVFTAGTVVDLEPQRMEAAAAPATGGHLTSVALLGTARRAVDLSALNPAVGAVATRLSAEPARLLLESVALHEAFARAGVRAERAELPVPAADDPRRQLPVAAALRLAAMLRERSVFLPEWFEAAAPHDFRAPEAWCALLLEQASAHAGLRPLLLRLAGERGRWLAAQHPEWRKLEWPSSTEEDTDGWESGKPAERLAWLTRLRHREPDAAREALTLAWPRESGALKAELLAVLSQDLSTKDEPLLETALDDRRADVRRTASGLLALLPDSAFTQRMTARARDWVGIELGAPAFVIDLPNPLDAEARRDGIFDRPVEFTYRWNGAPDPTAGRLRQLVAATPLPHWQALAGGDPAAVVRVGVEERFRQPLFDGWVDAALAQHDSAWARALFEAGVPSDVALLRRRELFALLPEADRVRHLLRLDGAWFSEIEALLPAMGHPWPEPLAQHLILLLFERSRVAAQRAGAHGSGPAAHRALLQAAAAHLPVGAAATAAVVARRCEDPAWERAFDRLARDLTHRSMMLEELQ